MCITLSTPQRIAENSMNSGSIDDIQYMDGIMHIGYFIFYGCTLLGHLGQHQTGLTVSRGFNPGYSIFKTTIKKQCHPHESIMEIQKEKAPQKPSTASRSDLNPKVIPSVV